VGKIKLNLTTGYKHQYQTTMNTISKTYGLKYQISFAPEYQFEGKKNGKCFNTKTGREIRKVVNGGSLGYWIKSKFYTVGNLRNKLELITKQKTPF